RTTRLTTGHRFSLWALCSLWFLIHVERPHALSRCLPADYDELRDRPRPVRIRRRLAQTQTPHGWPIDRQNHRHVLRTVEGAADGGSQGGSAPAGLPLAALAGAFDRQPARHVADTRSEIQPHARHVLLPPEI